MDLDLPLETISLDPQEIEDSRVFNYRIGLAIIYCHVYSRLLSIEALKQSVGRGEIDCYGKAVHHVTVMERDCQY
jgi:hypothetical protein